MLNLRLETALISDCEPSAELASTAFNLFMLKRTKKKKIVTEINNSVKKKEIVVRQRRIKHSAQSSAINTTVRRES